MTTDQRYPRVEADDRGVWCETERSSRYGIEWEQVSRVTAGRIGRPPFVDFTVELDDDHGYYVEINAAASGFDAALAGICERLPGVSASWQQDVAALTAGGPALLLWRRLQSP